MSSMSYCRFENTLADVRLCLSVLRDPEAVADLSKTERNCALLMLEDITDFMKDMDLLADYDTEPSNAMRIRELLYTSDVDKGV
jgi:hypothetical protein